MLQRIVDADCTPAQLSAELGMELTELSRWILDPENLRIVEGIARLSNVRAQMILSHYRSHAASRLITIAAAADPTELSRKACVDLLQTNLDVFPSPDENDSTASPAQAVPPSEQAILAALERFAAEADADPDEPPPGPPLTDDAVSLPIAPA